MAFTDGGQPLHEFIQNVNVFTRFYRNSKAIKSFCLWIFVAYTDETIWLELSVWNRKLPNII